jgi:DNA-binding response OmpR family regulator
MAKILIVEDDPMIRQLVRDALETERHTVDDCQDGRSGMAFIDAGSYELLVLDWEMPHATGIELCSHFRNQGEQAPVLFLTARASMDDKEKGFAVGADDYLTKPFDVRELLIRVKALLKRPQQITKDILKIGGMELDTNSGVVKRNDALIRLQPRELALLEFLMRHPDTFFTAEALMARVWDTDSEATEVALRSCITKMRRKMDVEGQPSFIETSKGLGYRINSKS